MSTGPDDPLLPPEVDKIHQELRLRWDAAEEAIKRAEVLRNLISVPAIAELRYAGRRVVDALGEKDKNKRRQLFSDACRICERAQFDALDAQVVYLLSTYKDVPSRRLREPNLAKFRQLHSLLSELMRAQFERRTGGRADDYTIERIVPLLNEATELHLNLLPDLMATRATDQRTALAGAALRWVAIALGALAISAFGAKLLGLVFGSGL